MTRFQGFETKEEARKFQREHGGLLTYEKRTKTGKPTGVGLDYYYAVEYGGLDSKKYPYAVQWNDYGWDKVKTD